METNELIAVLGSRAPRHSRYACTFALVGAVFVAAVFVLAMSFAWLTPRADLGADLLVHDHGFLLKLVFVVAVVASTLPVVQDLSVPGSRLGPSLFLAAVPFAIMAMLALRELGSVPGTWHQHVGHTDWAECLWLIPALAAPAFVFIVFVVRRLGPTNLARTGAFIGLLSGAIGALGYALHCQDDSVAFVGLFYTLAILETALFGALVGPRVLRWT